MAPQYRHAEAFCLMRYRCETSHCSNDEVIWNSRDGVTPFTVRCRWCGGTASHIDWAQDRREVDHRPAPGERFFRNATIEDLRAMHQARVDAGQYPPDFDVDEAARRDLTEHGEPPPWIETQAVGS